MFFLMSETGIYAPEDIHMIRQVFERLEAEGVLPASLEKRQALGRQALSIYSRGLCVEDQLFRYCKALARAKYQFEDDATAVTSDEGAAEAAS